MADGPPPPPTDDDIREYVEKILHSANLEKLTMKRVCKQVFKHYPGFDFAPKKEYIIATIMAVINSEPNMEQMEMLVEFLEANPEIVHSENGAYNEQTAEKWDAIATDLNALAGQIKTGESWAEFYKLLKIYINHIVVERRIIKRPRYIMQLYPRTLLKRMVMLLAAEPRIEENANEQLSDAEITAYVEQTMSNVDLQSMWVETVYHNVYRHFPGLDLALQRNFVKATIKSTLTSRPSIEQMEKLLKFLEDNPDIATGIGEAENADETFQVNHKWEAIADELNMLRGKSRSGDDWEDFWVALRTRVNQIIADRRAEVPLRGLVPQLFTQTILEKVIALLGGPPNEHIRPPPSDDQVKEFVEHLVHGANLKRITRFRVYRQLNRHFPGLDIIYKKEFIKAKVMSALHPYASIPQMEKFIKFLEENPELVTATGKAENAGESLQTTQKWDALANELNAIEGEPRTGESWAKLWYELRGHLNQIITDRKAAPATRKRTMLVYPRIMTEQLIILLGGPGNLNIPTKPSSDEIKQYVKQLCSDLEYIWRQTMYEQVCNHYPTVDLTQREEFIRAAIKSATRTHLSRSHALKLEDLPTGNERRPIRRRQPPSAAKLAWVAARRERRAKRLLRRPLQPNQAERIFNNEERIRQANLRRAEAMRNNGVTPEDIAAFIAACNRRKAMELKRRNNNPN